MQPNGLYSPWNSPGQNTRVGSCFLLQGISSWISPTQGLNPGLLHCRQILYHLSHQGSPPSKRVVSSAYLRLLIFLLAILIPACVSSSPAFRMMYPVSKLNKQGDNIQPWCTPFPIWYQSVVPCPVLTVASWPVYRFLRREVKVIWYSHFFKNFLVCCGPHSERP